MIEFPLKSILHSPDASQRLMKLAIELSQYKLLYPSKTAIKAQDLADFVVEFTPTAEEENMVTKSKENADNTSPTDSNLPNDMWQLHVDGASNHKAAGVGVVIITPNGTLLEQVITLGFSTSNNEAEYELVTLVLSRAFPWIRKKKLPCIIFKGDDFCYWGHAELACCCPSSALLDELVKKNADLTYKLSNERILHGARISQMKESMSAIKSFVGQNDGELKSLMATLLKCKEAYFCLECKQAALDQYLDKLLVKFDTHLEATKAS
ncbi:unnamed protein product [Prunus armeniaca]